MRRFSFVTAALVAITTIAGSATGTAAQQSPRSFGYINSEAILQATPEVREAQQALSAEIEGFRAEVQQMAENLDQMIQRYEQQQLTLSAEAKETKEQEIRTRQQQYQRRVQELDQLAAQRQSEVVQPIMDRINTVIEQIRMEGNYTIIFDVSTGAIIAADPDLDLTEQVIERLDTTGGSTGDEEQDAGSSTER